jgi:hypothetical protein
MKNALEDITKERAEERTLPHSGIFPAKFKPGDLFRDKSKEEIQETLNHWNQLKGCAFMEETWGYCGTNQKVFKRVERFLDEGDYLMKKCRGIILLEDALCEGTKDFGPCDHSCFFSGEKSGSKDYVDPDVEFNERL